MATASPTFKKVMKGLADGEKLIPAVRSYLYDPAFPTFEVQIHGFEEREPDYWFHPSTHPLWTERQLFFYLTQPEQLATEVHDMLSTMAITAGNFWHSFMQVCLIDAGILSEAEVAVADDDVLSRGHMDGTLVFGEAWEFKTMNGQKLNRLAKGSPGSAEVIESFKQMLPVYYAQAQEYMRMSGYRIMRVLIMETAYPFPMREIAIPYDPAFALGIRDKYARVRQAVADQRMPQPCCAPQSKEAKACPAREICPIGMM